MAEIFGILNVTDNSIHGANENLSLEAALRNAHALIDAGADYIDVGAEATNPRAGAISYEQEIGRLREIIPTLFQEFGERISIDTRHWQVVKWALEFGRPIVNDVTGIHEQKMVDIVARNGLRAIIGHLPRSANGDPFKSHTVEQMDDINEVITDIKHNAERLSMQGVDLEQCWFDSCIGFGKTMRLNHDLLAVASHLKGLRVLSGHSHKRFLGCDPTTGKPLPDTDELKVDMITNQNAAKTALRSGAVALRVHEPEWYTHLLK